MDPVAPADDPVAVEPDQVLADLVWAVSSPSFVTGANVCPPATLEPASVDVERLAAFVAAEPTRRVGRYFERLVEFWLRHVRGVEVLAVGEQIQQQRRTLGELDFVYRDERDAVVHAETAVKFFLHLPRAGACDFPGPNASDDFDKKVKRLFNHQLPLSVVHRPEVTQRVAIFKGLVFFHPDVGRPPRPLLPDRMPTVHPCGGWIRAGELEHLGSLPGVVCSLASKPYWLAAPQHDRVEEVGRFCDRVGDHFARGGHPLMLSVRNGSDLAERERFFVVPDGWPNRS